MRLQGLGTWSWGNQLLWGYDESMDPELQQVLGGWGSLWGLLLGTWE